MQPPTRVLAPAPGPAPGPEPITADPRHEAKPALLTQSWLDLAFLHWAVDPADVAPLLPPGTVPDTHDGVTYAGLVAFRMHRVGWFRLPGIPYLGSFPETNVRLYSVDEHGRRGVVFRSLDASRLIPVAIGRWAFRIPYVWSKMGVRQDGDTLTYTSHRRWPGPRGARSALSVRVGERIERPTDLEHFLTARWGMHSSCFGRPLYLPNTHPRWPLHRAELLSYEEDLLAAAGLTRPPGDPVSVLYSPGVPVRFGSPPCIPAQRPAPARESSAAPTERSEP
ncbi:YqjF family protein [Streptomyces sp. NPDC056632]|uniref:YqjF family protein n=1 Tax=Streptomyces sp. NPDC056632 TaxID=3345884 RepID=UPI003681F185